MRVLNAVERLQLAVSCVRCQDNSYMAAGAVGSYFWQGDCLFIIGINTG